MGRHSKLIIAEARREAKLEIDFMVIYWRQLNFSNQSYSYKDLKKATNNFSEDHKLGEGSFGVVYKGHLNGTTVAVKRLDISHSRAKADFESEGRLISNVHHRNLVRLLGCCSKGLELLLIYEYMENGSLDSFLYGEKKHAHSGSFLSSWFCIMVLNIFYSCLSYPSMEKA